MEVLKNVGRMFYIIDPADSCFENVEDIPQYYTEAWSYFLLFMVVENVLLWIDGKPTFRLNDGLTSIAHGVIQECGRLLFRGAESYCYIYIYQNYRILDLPWNNSATWYLAALGVDFCYYWVHRACHEVHILWAQHQVHHSSEEFNMAVGVRQSILQGWCGFVFYLPMAVAVPPSHFVAHHQFSLLYQFWIHTKVVKSLGPLEYIFNSPKHHRVHHGSNIYCLDKNYGGVLIVWDRLFGTFAEEKEDEEIIYGLVYNRPSFDPLYLQTFYSWYVWEKFRSMKGWKNRLAALFYGPSWLPGKPRLGLEEDKVKVTARQKYDVHLPIWCNIYLLVHFCVVVYGFQLLSSTYMGMSPISTIAFVCYVIGSLTTIGMLFDNNPDACVFEVLRCMILVTVVQRTELLQLNNTGLLAIEVFFLSSGLFWFLHCTHVLEIRHSSKL